MVSVSFDPVGNWFVVAGFAVVVTGLTLWAYSSRLRTSTGVLRYVALGLRLAAILLCLVAALRPSVVYQEKKKQPASFLIVGDASASMSIADEAGGESRWERSRKVVAQAQRVAKGLGDGLTVKSYLFDKTIHEDPADGKAPPPDGKVSAYGQALLDAVQKETGTRVAAILLTGDGANNFGPSPMTAANKMKAMEIPVITVGFGNESAGSKSRDLAVREVVTSPTVFVKNTMQLKGTVLARGFPNERLDLEMLVEGKDDPVATQRVKVPASADVIPFSMSYRPDTPGEKRVTVRVKPKEGELLVSNNTFSTFVTVLKGGLNVLFVQGPHAPWEQKYWMLSVASSPDIQADLRVVRTPARQNNGELSDEDFTPGRYDVYVLSDLPADFLTQPQQALLAHAVENRGAGLIMLGGRSSFGPGGWDRTEVARILPVVMRRNDPQIEPEAGVKFKPNPAALDSYLLQIAGTRAESAQLWNILPPLSGINHLGDPKPNAQVFGLSEGQGGEPIMIGAEVGPGRVLVFAGETWVWARASTETRAAHRKFWRQVIFWLAHKEDKGENEIKLRLDTRRIVPGQKLDFRVTTQDAKGAPIPNLKFETRVTLEGEGDGKTKYSEPLDPLFKKGDEYNGSFYANQAPPGVYRMTVVATRDGKPIGKDSARFIVYQDDRELENPAADRALLRQIAEATGGEALAPEKLPQYLQSLRGKLFTESYTQTERKIWDNWPFLLLFASLLTLEWFIRKRIGWV